MHPEEVPTNSLNPGQVGYIACNMKQSSEGEIPFFFFLGSLSLSLLFFSKRLTFLILAHIGDTIHRVGESVKPLAGFQPAKPMVRAPTPVFFLKRVGISCECSIFLT